LIYQLVPSEHQIQVAFIKEVRFLEPRYPELKTLFAVPNAAKRSFKLAAMLKAEGMLSGVPDIILPVARQGFNGLMIEFKKPKTGKLTEAQETYIDLVVKENWLVVVMTDAQAAIDVVKNYLGIKTV
jgi:VRR-NUC domain